VGRAYGWPPRKEVYDWLVRGVPSVQAPVPSRVFVQCTSSGSVVRGSEAPHLLRVLFRIVGKFGVTLRI